MEHSWPSENQISYQDNGEILDDPMEVEVKQESQISQWDEEDGPWDPSLVPLGFAVHLKEHQWQVDFWDICLFWRKIFICNFDTMICRESNLCGGR